MVADVEGDVGRHLVVARATGVELAPERPDDLGQAPLYRHVNVLVPVQREGAAVELLGDRLEALLHPRQLVGVQNPGRMQGARVRPRLLHVVRRQAHVEADRGVEALEQRVGRVAEPGHAGQCM
jgi:hypothetical protein